MPLLTKKEFAKQCGIKTNRLSVEIDRNKVYEVDGLIDTDNELNAAFIERSKVLTALRVKRIEQAPIKAAKPPKVKAPKVVIEDTDDDDDDIEVEEDGDLLDILSAEKKYKHFLAVRTERGAELDEIKIQKLQGILVPTELVKHLLRQHTSNITKVTKETLEDVIVLWAAKYKIQDDDTKKMRKTILEKINFGIDRAIADTKKQLGQLIDAYSETRGKGERK
jgi:hypothetical protein